MFKRIDHVEIIVRDLDESIDFYTNVLGFRVKERTKMNAHPLQEIAYLELNDTVVEFMLVEGAAPVSDDAWQIGLRMMALEVEDMDRVLEYLKSEGIETSWGPVSFGKSKRAEIKDPNGLRIELRQW